MRNLPLKATSFRLQTATDWFYPDFVCQLRERAGSSSSTRVGPLHRRRRRGTAWKADALTLALLQHLQRTALQSASSRLPISDCDLGRRATGRSHQTGGVISPCTAQTLAARSPGGPRIHRWPGRGSTRTEADLDDPPSRRGTDYQVSRRQLERSCTGHMVHARSATHQRLFSSIGVLGFDRNPEAETGQWEHRRGIRQGRLCSASDPLSNIQQESAT